MYACIPVLRKVESAAVDVRQYRIGTEEHVRGQRNEEGDLPCVERGSIHCLEHAILLSKVVPRTQSLR